jgi:hypothetical protein
MLNNLEKAIPQLTLPGPTRPMFSDGGYTSFDARYSQTTECARSWPSTYSKTHTDTASTSYDRTHPSSGSASYNLDTAGLRGRSPAAMPPPPALSAALHPPPPFAVPPHGAASPRLPGCVPAAAGTLASIAPEFLCVPGRRLGHASWRRTFRRSCLHATAPGGGSTCGNRN